jgi:hypothetical protein
MPRRELLTEPQRLAFTESATYERGMVRHYTVSTEDLALIDRRRGDPNRLAPAKSSARRAGRVQLQASIEDLGNRGGRLTHSLCGDSKRFYVLIPAHPVTWNTADNKDAVYVVPVGY